MTIKVRIKKRKRRVFKPRDSLRRSAKLWPNLLAELDSDSEQRARGEWEQLWKQAMSRKENALIRVR